MFAAGEARSANNTMTDEASSTSSVARAHLFSNANVAEEALGRGVVKASGDLPIPQAMCYKLASKVITTDITRDLAT